MNIKSSFQNEDEMLSYAMRQGFTIDAYHGANGITFVSHGGLARAVGGFNGFRWFFNTSATQTAKPEPFITTTMIQTFINKTHPEALQNEPFTIGVLLAVLQSCLNSKTACESYHDAVIVANSGN